jgi:4-carboxymuconolactone decarboxylase
MRREALLEVSAAIASRSDRSLERALRLARRFSTREAVDEVLLQAHLFVGFPIALEALMRWRRMEPVAEVAGTSEKADSWPARGEAVCRTVYGRSYEKLRANVAALHPDLDRWMVAGGYGRVIGRAGLSLATRELCTVALLVVWDAPRQLHSHLRGAANSGASNDEIDAAVEVGCRYLGPAGRRSVRDLMIAIRS